MWEEFEGQERSYERKRCSSCCIIRSGRGLLKQTMAYTSIAIDRTLGTEKTLFLLIPSFQFSLSPCSSFTSYWRWQNTSQNLWKISSSEGRHVFHSFLPLLLFLLSLLSVLSSLSLFPPPDFERHTVQSNKFLLHFKSSSSFSICPFLRLLIFLLHLSLPSTSKLSTCLHPTLEESVERDVSWKSLDIIRWWWGPEKRETAWWNKWTLNLSSDSLMTPSASFYSFHPSSLYLL